MAKKRFQTQTLKNLQDQQMTGVIEDLPLLATVSKTIARATGRDSGAYPCKDIIFEVGKPESKGFRAKWRAAVPAGCVVRLSNVSPALWREFTASEHDGITAEICKGKINIDALLEEN